VSPAADLSGVERGNERYRVMHGLETGVAHILPPPCIMGILNTTPDSFSDGGAYASVDAAVAQGLAMIAEGATWLDIGGESTRPGAAEVAPEIELARVVPVIEALAGRGARLSIDTRKSTVAAAALAAGAELVNDVSGGLFDERILAVTAKAGALYCAMHMRGTPANAAIEAGIAPERLILDPGIGFAKKLPHNLAVLKGLGSLASLGFPLIVGLSRKKMILELTGVEEPKQRLAGSLAGLTAAVLQGAHILRVHDVKPSVEAAAVAAALR
jgi:dihydropteroate synthase